jgi:tRNA U55 pseudouridine synthase TruB
VREAIGDFTLQSAVPLANLTSATLPGHLLPPLEAVRHLPRCEVSEMELRQLALGRALSVDREFPAGKPVAITGSAGELLALGEYVPDRRVIQPRQVFARE